MSGLVRGTCDYGCGQDATHVFKNGTKCCSRYPVKCPKIRERIGRSVKEYHERVDGSVKKQEKVKCKDTEFFE